MLLCKFPTCFREGYPFILQFSARVVRTDLCPEHALPLVELARYGQPAYMPTDLSADQLRAIQFHPNNEDYGLIGLPPKHSDTR